MNNSHPHFAADKKLVLIPLFNEANTVTAVLSEIRKYYADDILIINDGSTDQSAQIIASFQDNKLKVITHTYNQGYGQSLIDGFSYAIENQYGALVTIDGDFQHEPCHIPQFFNELKNADIVSGSRYFFNQENVSDAPKDRYLINRTITKELNEITSFGISDAFCGYKAYRVCGLKKLHLNEPGYAMPLQFWIQAFLANLSVKEIPIKRIYLNLNKMFGNGIDDPEIRLNYYREIIRKEIENGCRHTAHCSSSR